MALALAIALPGVLAAAPAAQADCTPTYPAFGSLSQPAAGCPPVASFTADHTQLPPPATIHFDATSSSSTDPGGITEYDWDFGDGNTEVDGPGTTTTQHNYTVQGQYDVTLTVKDAGTTSGVTFSMKVHITQPPVAALNVTPNAIEVGQSATLDASGSTDSDGTVATYEWDFNGDGTYTAPSASSSVSHVYPSTGNFNPKVRVTDNDGATDVVQASLNVHNPPVVTFTLSPTLVAPGGSANFDGSGSSSSHPGGITEYAWDFGDGNFVSSGTSATTSHVFPTRGHFSVRLRIKDGANPSGVISSSKPITVSNTPIAQLTASPNAAAAGQSITLDASASYEPGGSIVRYDWDLEGDGSYDLSTTTPTISHVYPNPGNLTPKVRVTDDFGIASVQSTSLAVSNSTGGGGTGPGGGVPGGSDNSSGGAAAFAARLTGSPIQGFKLVTKVGLTVLCSANRTATCTLRLEVSARDARRLGMRSKKGRSVQIGTARATLSSSRTAMVRFTFTSRVKRALRRVRSVKVSVVGTAADAGGARVSLTRVVLIRR